MTVYCTDFNSREMAMFALRSLYSRHGFSMFRMSKFVPFEVYAGNRDYLESSSMITFTDTDGMLMALKPDVTLSIVKNNRNIGDEIRKIYYNENVYRVSPKTHFFKEIMQVGLECLGKIDDECICEVLVLAAESLQLLSDSVKLDISNLDILSRLIEGCGVTKETGEQITKCIGEKNVHELSRICSENSVDPVMSGLLKKLITTYGDPDKVIPELEAAFAETEGSEDYMKSMGTLRKIVKEFEEKGLRNILNIDFSVVSNLSYYNGIIFKGFLEGIPDGILSGGQYDKLMKSMRSDSKAIGFAVYLDDLGKLEKLENQEVMVSGKNA